MAAVDGLTNTSQNDLVATEGIHRVVLKANEIPRIFMTVGWIIPADQNRSGTLRLPREDTIDPSSGTKTETDEAAFVSFTTSKADVTAGVVIVRSLLSDEHQQDGGMTIERSFARQLQAMSKRQDSDLLALATSATYTSDSTGVAMTLDLWEAARSAYLAQNPVIGAGGFHAWVSTPKHVSKLQSLIRQAGGSQMLAGAGLAMWNKAPMAEYAGPWQGMEVFQGNCPANDADNTSSAFLCAGDEGAYAMGVWWAQRPDIIRVPGRVGEDLVTTSRYGVTISNQANLREFIALK